MTIPSPSAVHFRDGRDAVPASIYPDMEDFYRDLGQTYRKAVRAFADAGCRYLQLDEVNLTYLCDPKLIQQVRDRGEDPEELPARLRADDQRGDVGHSRRHDDHHASVPRQFPLDLHRRGRLRAGGRRCCSTPSTCTAISWSTTPSAPAASSRCASCRRASRWCSASSPRRPARSKSKDEIKRRIDEAAKFVPLDQLCLSPQCGFASSEEGNVLAEEEQWAKLRMIVEIADEVWGGERCARSLRGRPGDPAARERDPHRGDRRKLKERNNETHQAALPRRPRRQPAAPQGASMRRGRSAPRARSRPRPEGDRGPRDRAHHQEAGGRRPASRSPTASSAARGGISISSGASTAPRSTSWTPASQFAAVDDAERRRPGHRQARHGRAASDGRAFQVRRGAHQAHAEDHHSGAVGDLRPADDDADRQDRSIRTWTSSSTISARPTRRRCAASPTPAAAICSSTKCSSPCCAIRNIASR